MTLPTHKTRVSTSIHDYIGMVYGPPGVGKSTFVDALAPRVLFLSTDRGTRFFEALRQEVFTWKDIERVLKDLETPQAPKYDIIAVDHVDDVALFCENEVCRSLGIDGLGDAGFGKGWKMMRLKFFGMCERIMRLGTGLVFIAHEDIKTVKVRGREINKVTPSLGKTARTVVLPTADWIGYAGFQTVVRNDPKGGKQQVTEHRTLTTTPREDLYAKDRTNRVHPPIELLDGASFIKTFSTIGASNGQDSTRAPTSPRPRVAATGPRGRRAR